MATTENHMSAPEDELPDRGFEWEDDTGEISGATFVPNAERVQFPATDRSIYLAEHTVGYVLDGIEEYLDENAERELTVPSAYNSMDEFPGYIGSVSARGQDFGMGFDSGRLEAGIRVATGGGRYSVDDITVIACGDASAVFRVPEGDFLITPSGVPSFESEEAHAYPTYTVKGMDVPEENETLRDGIRELADLLRDVEGVELVAHEKLSGTRHYLTTQAGETIRISGQDLATLTETKRDPETVLGTQTWDRDHSPHSFEVEVTEEDLEWQIGDEFLGEVIGFQLDWKTDHHGRYSRESGIRRVRLQVTYVRYTLDDRVNISTSTRDIQTWEL